MGAETLARLAQFAVLGLAARALTAADFGIYGLGVAIYQLALAVVQNGPDLHAIRLQAQGGGGRALVGRVMRLKGGLALVAYLLLCLMVRLLYPNPAVWRQVAVQALLLPIAALNTLWVLRATGLFPRAALWRGVQAMLFLALAALFLRPGALGPGALGPGAPASPLALPLAEGAATLLVVLAALPQGLAFAGAGSVPAPRAPLLAPSLALGLSGLCSDAIWSMPVTMGGLFLGAGPLGRVAAVNRILVAGNGIYQLMLQVFYPALARRHAGPLSEGGGLAGALLLYSAVGSVLVVGLVSAVAPSFVRLLLGAGHGDVVPLLRLCLMALPPACVGAVAGYTLLAGGWHGVFTRLSLALVGLTGVMMAAGYALWPEPRTAALQAVALLLYAVGALVATARRRLLGPVRLALLRPATILDVLSQR